MRPAQRLLAVILFLLLSASTDAAGVRLTLRTDDGATIVGSFYQPAQRPAPAVVLVHMLTRTRADWDRVAQELADRGIGALAIDLRGHGDSTPPPGPASPAPTPEPVSEVMPLLADVRAAVRFLDSRPDVLADRIGLAGASVGANLAAIVAAAEPHVRAIALLSPGLDYRGLRIEAPMRKYGARPALIVASREDPYALRSARELGAVTDGIRDVRVLEAAGHGTVMLARSPDLVRALVDWFLRTLL